MPLLTCPPGIAFSTRSPTASAMPSTTFGAVLPGSDVPTSQARTASFGQLLPGSTFGAAPLTVDVVASRRETAPAVVGQPTRSVMRQRVCPAGTVNRLLNFDHADDSTCASVCCCIETPSNGFGSVVAAVMMPRISVELPETTCAQAATSSRSPELTPKTLD